MRGLLKIEVMSFEVWMACLGFGMRMMSRWVTFFSSLRDMRVVPEPPSFLFFA